MSVEARGVVKKGYKPVARLTSWSLANSQGTSSVSGTVADVDAFTVDEGGPFTVVLYVGDKQWQWSDVDVRWGASSMSATLHGQRTVRG